MFGCWRTTSAAPTTTDNQIIDQASFYDATYSYTGEKLTTINYVDTADITSNTKTLGYNISDELIKTTHIFTYNSQTWTVTVDYAYSSGKLSTKTVTIGKA